MRRTQRVVVVLLLLVAAATLAGADTFYVATPANGGSNSNPGTQAQPWATIQFAVNSVGPGDTIIVTPGTYVGAFFDQSGDPGSPIVVQGQPGAIVTSESPDGFNEDNFEIRASYITIEGFEVHSAGRAGIAVIGEVDAESEGVVLRNNYCHDNATWGIFTGYAKDILIESNETSGSGEEHGIYVSNSSDNPIIRYNIVHHNFASGIQINADPDFPGDKVISNAVVDSNIIYENGVAGGAAINLASVSDSVIINNLLYGNHAGGVAGWDNGLCPNPGGSCDQIYGTKNNRIINNTVVMPSDGRACISLLNASINNEIKNNILIHPFRPSVNTDLESQPGIDSNYNLVTNVFSEDDDTFITLAAWQALGAGHDQNSTLYDGNAAALFVNTAGNDYHILATGQADDAGTTVLGVPDDLEATPRPQGTAYDIGCYELLQACPGDTTDPTTSITSPADNDTVDGTVNIAADADDDCAVIKVEFYVDGNLLGFDSTAPYTYEWDTMALANGAYVLTTIAYDSSGNTGGSAPVDVTIDNQFLFFDDFEDNNPDGWTFTKGSWTGTDGDLVGTATRKADILSPAGWGGCSQCTIEADLRMTAGGRASLLAWYTNKQNMVEIALMEDKNKVLLKQKSGGDVVAKNKALVAINANQNYHLQVSYNGSSFQVLLDDVSLFTISAGAAPSGLVGFLVKPATVPSVTGNFEEILVY